MPAQRSLLDELVAAGRGCVALIVGDRRAAAWFDLSPRGLVGSFIALLVALTLSAYWPTLLGVRMQPGAPTLELLGGAILFVTQLVASAILLRQIGRLDGLVPYIVADNWATFYAILISALLAAVGMGPIVFILLIVAIVVEINIARLIVTLTTTQIVMFIIARLVGGLAGWLVVAAMFPSSADTLPV